MSKRREIFEEAARNCFAAYEERPPRRAATIDLALVHWTGLPWYKRLWFWAVSAW